MRKRGEITAFVRYLIAILLIAFIVILAYQAFQGIKIKNRNLALIAFKTKFNSEVETLTDKVGSSKEFNTEIPEDVDEICMLSYERRDQIFFESGLTRLDHYSIINDSIYANVTKNVFLFSRGKIVDSFFIPNIYPSNCPPFLCTKIKNPQNLKMFLSGFRDGYVLVSMSGVETEPCPPPDAPAPEDSLCANGTKPRNWTDFCYGDYCYELYIYPSFEGKKVSIYDANRTFFNKTEDTVEFCFEDWVDFDCNDVVYEVTTFSDHVSITEKSFQTIAKDTTYILFKDRNGVPISNPFLVCDDVRKLQCPSVNIAVPYSLT